MSDVVIQVENLSKQYRLGTVGTGALAHDLNRWWSRLRGKPDPYLKVTEANDRAHKGDSEYVWALKDIDFEVKRGEVLGIIGRNGAGKSTLLKILSRITAPTTGEIRVKGRIGSLLEVGTGFHPELTGRENIFLNGAILGMTKAEIRAKLDEIIDFSGCERYLDTPVKRYSSGMMVRLGFAVAAHLEPEILIVDEVLAVGDAEFQKKCLGKMKDVAEHGRTVLFVSHNLTAVRSLCPLSIWLDSASLVQQGDTEEIVARYISETIGAEQYSYIPAGPDGTGNDIVRLLGLRLRSDSETIPLTNGQTIHIEAIVNIIKPGDYSCCTPVWRNGELAFIANSYYNDAACRMEETGIFCLKFSIPPHILNPGQHEISFYLTDGLGAHEHYIRVEKVLRANIEDDEVRRGGKFNGAWPGCVSPILPFEALAIPCQPQWLQPSIPR